MSKMKFKLNRKGVKELMLSKESEALMQEHANRIVSRAGSGFSSQLVPSKNRKVVRVFPETSSAKTDNYKNNTLLKAVR